MSDEAYDACIDLLRRSDPANVSRNVTNLCRLNPELAQDLLASVDQPLSYFKCPDSGKNYIKCEYNRDGDSYRSPWSNKYYPALSAADAAGAPCPANDLRELELFANDSFDIYRDLYYEGGVSSVYLWNPDEESDPDDVSKGFSGAVLMKKESNSSVWDSTNVIDVTKKGEESYEYVLTSTVILSVKEDEELGFSGSLTRQSEKTISAKSSADHIANIGGMVEDMENKLRNQIQEVYFGKTKDLVSDLRSVEKISGVELERKLQGDVIKGIQEL